VSPCGGRCGLFFGRVSPLLERVHRSTSLQTSLLDSLDQAFFRPRLPKSQPFVAGRHTGTGGRHRDLVITVIHARGDRVQFSAGCVIQINSLPPAADLSHTRERWKALRRWALQVGRPVLEYESLRIDRSSGEFWGACDIERYRSALWRVAEHRFRRP
jgi:hypothetical protein